jgi:hypothetical protein
MQKKISEIAEEMRLAMKKNPGLAVQNMFMAIAALKGGIKSTAWEDYMKQFVYQEKPGTFDPDQLARLLAQDGTAGDPVLDRRRAYLVANGVCGPSTEFTTTIGVETIDYTLPHADDITSRGAFDCNGDTGPKPSQKRGAAKKGGKKKGAKKSW